MAKEDIDLVYENRLDRQDGVVKNGKEIKSIKMEDGTIYRKNVYLCYL